jgi:hypothetical protein
MSPLLAALVLGFLLGIAGTIWIAVIAFQKGDLLWAIASIFCGIAAVIYGVQHLNQAKIPLALLIAGTAITVVGRILILQADPAL